MAPRESAKSSHPALGRGARRPKLQGRSNCWAIILSPPIASSTAMATTLSDLVAQKDALERQIRDARASMKANAIARVHKLMSEHGLTPADLIAAAKGKTAIKTGAKVAVKFRDPITGSTWSGRGLRPRWLAVAIEGGRSADEFLI